MPQTRERLIAGTSSFGMSGVNAHGLYCPPEEVPEARTTAVPWQRTRHWFVPSAHHLLQAFAYDRQTVLARWTALEFRPVATVQALDPDIAAYAILASADSR